MKIPFADLRPFNPKAVLRDVFAGLTLASVNVPQVLGYARIAGMPVVTGLYTVLLPTFVFAVFGSSRHLVVGRRAAANLMTKDEARRIAAGIAKLPELLNAEPRPDANALLHRR